MSAFLSGNKEEKTEKKPAEKNEDMEVDDDISNENATNGEFHTLCLQLCHATFSPSLSH